VDAGDQGTEPGESPQGELAGRGPHQAPEVDGNVRIQPSHGLDPAPGSLVRCRITGSDGIDLVAVALEVVQP
jgi:hypothetical protein